MSSRLAELLSIMRRLREKDGCPWDRAQTFASIAPYTVEEAYEVADAIDRGDLAHLKGELGDLMFQVVFHAQMASEQGAFDFEAVVGSICDKLIRRHPHVFGETALAPRSKAPPGRTSRPRSAAAGARSRGYRRHCRRS